MRFWLGFRAHLLLAGSAVLLATAGPVAAQTSGPPDTGTSFTGDMRLLDGRLLRLIRESLERSGHSFYALALYVADTAGPPVVNQYFIDAAPLMNDPQGIADVLRAVARRNQTDPPAARTIGIIVDSIDGPISKAVEGSFGPPYKRVAITELEDRNGRCRRIERDYRFEKDPPGDDSKPEKEFGHIVFGDARVTRCQPRRYWPVETATPTDSKPRLAAPIVRPLLISSLDNYFSVVGRFSGALTVFDDSIVVHFDSLVATRRLRSDDQQVRLDSIRVGVGVGSTTVWSPVDDSNALPIDLDLARGEAIERKNARFVIRHERRMADDDSWIVVTFHITANRDGKSASPTTATTYAHSTRGVLAAAK